MKKQVIIMVLVSLLISACDESSSSNENTDISSYIDEVSFTDSALIITNTSGDSSGGSEYIGETTSFSINASSSANTATTRSSQSLPLIPGHHNLPALSISENTTVRSTRSSQISSKSNDTVTSSTDNYTFYGYDENGDLLTISATKVYGDSSTKALIFVEDENAYSSGYSSTFDTVGESFDNTIYPKVTEAFAKPTDVDDNDQVVILYYSMNSSTLRGFFYNLDLYDQDTIDNYFGSGSYYSNEMEIFYINTDIKAPDNSKMLSVLAHEFQHMVNAGYHLTNKRSYMDTWIDEGLAMAAEDYVFDTTQESRINWYNGYLYTTDSESQYSNKYIRNGHPLCLWYEDTYHSLANYSLSYLFIQYLRIHSDSGTGIYKKILENNNSSYLGLTEVMLTENDEFTDFPTILKYWRIANILQKSSGLYGYGDDASKFKLNTYEPNKTVNFLYPGGSIYYKGDWNDIDSVVEDRLTNSPSIEYSKIQKGEVNEI